MYFLFITLYYDCLIAYEKAPLAWFNDFRQTYEFTKKSSRNFGTRDSTFNFTWMHVTLLSQVVTGQRVNVSERA